MAVIGAAPFAAAQTAGDDALTNAVIEERKAKARQALNREREARDAERAFEAPDQPRFPETRPFPAAPWENDRAPRARDLADDPSTDWLRLLLTPLRVGDASEDAPDLAPPDAPAVGGPRVIRPAAPATPTAPSDIAAPVRPATPAEVEARKTKAGG